MCECEITYDILDEVIYSAKKKLKSLTEELLRFYVYGYACNAEELINKLSLYLDSVERYRLSLVSGVESCLSCKEFQIILEEVRTLTISCDRRTRIDQTVDRSAREAWELTNPYCAPKTRWQQLALRICSDLKFDIKIKDVSEALICKLLYDVAVTMKNCEVGFKVEINDKECELEYDVITKNKNCTISYDTYLDLKECGVTYESVITAYECGLEINYDITNECPEITYGTRSCPLVGTQVTVDCQCVEGDPPEIVECPPDIEVEAEDCLNPNPDIPPSITGIPIVSGGNCVRPVIIVTFAVSTDECQAIYRRVWAATNSCDEYSEFCEQDITINCPC